MNRNISSSRLKEIRRKYKEGEHTQESFADYLGISVYTYKSMEQGKLPLTVDKINILKEKVDVNPLWLLYGEGSMFISDSTNTKDALIPYYDDIKASAGFGATNGDVKEPEYIHLPKAFITECSRTKTEAIKCSGDSMAPSLRDGDVMFVDRNQREIKDGEIYIVRFGEDIFVKRLFKAPGGKLVAKSDNAIYPEFVLNDEPFDVLGRVIYKMERV